MTRGNEFRGAWLRRAALMLAAGTAWPMAAVAQTETAASDAGGVEDIVVTATRREERLQDVPVAVTAMSSKMLDAQNITNSVQIAQTTPGVVMARSLQNIQLSIRGITSRATAMGDESNIAVYIDGIYQPTVFATAFELGKVERVEILRGPQGTLFGRNSTGGLVNIITPDPAREWEGRARFRIGSYGEKSANVNVSGPISEHVGIDLSGIFYDDHGFTQNLFTGERVGDRRNVAGRAKLLIEPSDAIRITLTGTATRINDSSSVMNQPIGRQTIAVQTPGAIIASAPNTVSHNFDPSTRITQETASGKLEFDLGGVTLESTTAYQYNKLKLATDNDFSQITRFNITTQQTSSAASQELRLLSQDSGRFKWTAGVFLFQDIGRYSPATNFTVSANVGGTASTSQQVAKNKTQSAAVYAEGTLSLTDQFKVTAGGRYTWERRHFTATRVLGPNDAADPGPCKTPRSVDCKANYKQFTPRVSVMYKPSDNVNAYVTYSKGFKSGVFNTTGLNRQAVRPEKLESFEGGLKTDPLDWLRVNLSGFLYTYTDFQVTGRDPSGNVLLLNAKEAKLKGGELEVVASPLRDLNLRFSAALLDTKFTDFNNAQIIIPVTSGPTAGTGTAFITSANGKKLQRAPAFTFNAGFDYAFDLTDTARAGFSANLYHSSKYFWEFSNRLVQKGYYQLGGQVWIEPVDNFRLGVWAENLTNAHVLQQALATALGDNGVYNKPRSIGVFANIDF